MVVLICLKLLINCCLLLNPLRQIITVVVLLLSSCGVALAGIFENCLVTSSSLAKKTLCCSYV